MGHIADGFESAGFPTIAFVVRAFKSRVVPMRVPRLVITSELMGKTLGKLNDGSTQRRYLDTGLELLENVSAGNINGELEKLI